LGSLGSFPARQTKAKIPGRTFFFYHRAKNLFMLASAGLTRQDCAEQTSIPEDNPRAPPLARSAKSAEIAPSKKTTHRREPVDPAIACHMGRIVKAVGENYVGRIHERC
jgi:hypothetical protein